MEVTEAAAAAVVMCSGLRCMTGSAQQSQGVNAAAPPWVRFSAEHEGKQHEISRVLGSLPPTWETEFQASALPGHRGHLGNEPQGRRALA